MHLILTHEQADFDALASLLAASLITGCLLYALHSPAHSEANRHFGKIEKWILKE